MLKSTFQVATDHGDETWNWTGWVPRWRREILWDPIDKKTKFINNRFFMALRTHEVQNNAWDYHPLEDVEGPYDDLQGTNIRLPEHDDVDGERVFTMVCWVVEFLTRVSKISYIFT